MMGFNTISDKLFGGHNNVRPKPFIAPDADIVDAEIINKEFVNEKKPFIYPENRNSGFFNQDSFFKSAPFSQAAIAPQAYVLNGSFPDRLLFGNARGPFRSFNSPKKLAQFSRELANA